ncbi:hypothetical protein AB0I77_25050 [Streptomyces sp. NPDC050619]|uniref:hypothetical protein n=1 Tax=Streptomyces sp. NPDC050619 TaxID=3157214 RepID=UPI003424C260
MAFGVGALLGHEEVGGSGADTVDPGLLVDLLGDQVLGGVLEGLGHGGAVPVALDEFGAGEAGLDAELVLRVVVDGLVAHGADGELVVLLFLVVVGAVTGEITTRQAVVDLLESFDGDVAGTEAGLVDREGDDQSGDDVGVGGAVGQRDAVVVGVPGDDERGVVAEQPLLDPVCFLPEFGAVLVLLGGGEVVEGEGVLVLGGAELICAVAIDGLTQ